jgi:hypothetical protein
VVKNLRKNLLGFGGGCGGGELAGGGGGVKGTFWGEVIELELGVVGVGDGEAIFELGVVATGPGGGG